MSQSRTAAPVMSLTAAGWVCAIAGILALLPDTGEAYIELPGRVLVCAAVVCWAIQAGRKRQH